MLIKKQLSYLNYKFSKLIYTKVINKNYYAL